MDSKKIDKKAELEKKLASLEAKKKGLAEKASLIKKRLEALDKPGEHLTSKQQTQVKILYGDATLKLCKEDEALAARLRAYLDAHTRNKTYRRILGLPIPTSENPTQPQPKAQPQPPQSLGPIHIRNQQKSFGQENISDQHCF